MLKLESPDDEDGKYELLKKDMDYLKQELIRQDKEIQTLNKKVLTKKQLIASNLLTCG